MNEPVTAVIVVAAGSGSRAQDDGAGRPKQFRLLGGQPVLTRAIRAFTGRADIALVQPVIGLNQQDAYRVLSLEHDTLLPAVPGGAERQASVLAGLEALAEYAPDRVLIHDAARPLVPNEVIASVLAALDDHAAVLPVMPVSDTIKRSTDGAHAEGTENRAELWAAQTPQGFGYPAILDAHRRAAQAGRTFTDDAAIAEWAGMSVRLVAGDRHNIKVTEPGDFALAAWLMGADRMESRTGTGLDIHRFTQGNTVRLAEVDIEHTASLEGHSDADAALHVLTDALLGAIAEGDIGAHFPPSDAKWKGEPSRTFFAFAAGRVRERGGRIVHLDLTLMCESPKIGPHVAAMRANIAAICGIAVSRVSVKATTAEGMGFIGRGEGLLAHGTATVELPGEEV